MAAVVLRADGEEMKLTQDLQQRLASAVQAAEKKTGAEFVTVVARRSLQPSSQTILILCFAASAIPAVLWIAGWRPDFAWLYLTQVAAFSLLALGLLCPAAQRFLVSPGERQRQAAAKAREHFAQLGLHRTRQSGGVLLFVALDARYVEVIADEAALAALPADTWQTVIDRFTAKVKVGDLEAGFTEALAFIGERMVEKLPRLGDDKNELPDNLIVV